MKAHHTKSKGDVGVAHVFANLGERGHVVVFPATEHGPFDLVSGIRDIRFPDAMSASTFP